MTEHTHAWWRHREKSVFEALSGSEGFPGGSEAKVSACNVGDLGSILGREDPLEKEMATHSSTLDWTIP